MRRCIPCLLLLLLFFPGPAQSKKKDPDIPALFRQAHYVYVEAVDGDEFNPRLYPEDRQAIADVRQALQTWNRYTLTIPASGRGPGLRGAQGPHRRREGVCRGPYWLSDSCNPDS
jgi:hypothetical protein